ncbi:MAG: amidohydrolase family protein [Burkholderiales bacterium]|nr:MAG: amidohydrolase family protein [Burkholderiales bacterium]
MRWIQRLCSSQPASVLRTTVLLLLVIAVPAPPARALDAPTERKAYAEAYAALRSALADEPAIDNHTHLVYSARYDERYVEYMPLVMRQDIARQLDLAEALFGTRDPTEAAAIREARVAAEGDAYWERHLDATRTRIALVNTMRPFAAAGGRLRRVPFASYLLFPVRADNYPLHPEAAATASRAREWLAGEGGADAAALADLDAYLAFVDRTLAQWAQTGAVGIKFIEGLVRPLHFTATTRQQAAELYAAGRAAPLSRTDYLRLQDHVARHIFARAPEHGLAVHIHVGAGNPPFLRLGDNSVHQLENVLANPRFFGTQFVLIHGGFPEVEAAAYQSLRPNVWIDISAQSHFVPVRDLAGNLRTYLGYSPRSVLFGTDVSSFPGVPAGPEVQHLVVSERLRDALDRALAEMVAAGEVTVEQAISMARDVLHGNAERLYGFAD